MSLPTDVDAEKVDASLEHGVLTVRLPKSEQTKPRRIQVSDAAK
jgi:HSP20 family protein